MKLYIKYVTELVLNSACVCTLPLGTFSLVLEDLSEASLFSILFSANHQEGNCSIADVTTKEKSQSVWDAFIIIK